MRSPWRVPQQSAGRRARPARARCRPNAHKWRRCARLLARWRWLACAFRRSAPSFGGESILAWSGEAKLGRLRAPRERICLSARSLILSPLPRAGEVGLRSNPGEGLPPFWAKRKRPLIPTFSPHAGRRSVNAPRVRFSIRHCERQRSNPGRLARKLDCFVAVAPRNDESRRGECNES